MVCAGLVRGSDLVDAFVAGGPVTGLVLVAAAVAVSIGAAVLDGVTIDVSEVNNVVLAC